MQDTFNPYREWLGIAEGRPAQDYYELLGLDVGESDTALIAHRADVLTANIRKIRPGPHLAAWREILDNLIAAKACLLDAGAKAAYDAQLRSRSSAPIATPPPAVASPVIATPPPIAAPPAVAPPSPEPKAPEPVKPGDLDPWAAAMSEMSGVPEPSREGTKSSEQASKRPNEPAGPPSIFGDGPPVFSAPTPVFSSPTPVFSKPLPFEPLPPEPAAPKPTLPEPMMPAAATPIEFVASEPAPSFALGKLLAKMAAVFALVTLGVVGTVLYQQHFADSGPTVAGNSSSASGVGETPAPPGRTAPSTPVSPAPTQASATVPQADAPKPVDPPGSLPNDAPVAPPKPELPPDAVAAAPAAPVEPGASSETNPAASPGVDPAPVAPPTPNEPFLRAISAARAAMKERNYPVARTHLTAARQAAAGPEEQAQVQRVGDVLANVEQFWKGISRVLGELQPAQEFSAGNTQYIVVEVTPARLTLRTEGRNVAFDPRKLPAAVAAGMAESNFTEDASSMMLIGAFLAAEGDAAGARKAWQLAARGGASLGDMMKELDEAAPGAVAPANPLEAKIAELEQKAKAAQTTVAHKEVADAAMAMAKDAAAANRIAEAHRLVDLAMAEAQRSRNVVLFRSAKTIKDKLPQTGPKPSAPGPASPQELE